MADAPTVTISPEVIPDYDIYCNAVAAGFTSQQAVTMTAIGLAESGGNICAISGLASNGDGSRGYGLFQIEWPTHAGLFPGNGSTQNAGGPGIGWIVPNNNAKMAKSVFDSQGFGAWSTYKSGAYLAFMGRALMTPTQVQIQAGQASRSVAQQVQYRVYLDEVAGGLVAASAGLAQELGGAATAEAKSSGESGQAITSIYDTYSGPAAGNPLLRVIEIFMGGVLLIVGLKYLVAPAASVSGAVVSAAKLGL